MDGWRGEGEGVPSLSPLAPSPLPHHTQAEAQVASMMKGK